MNHRSRRVLTGLLGFALALSAVTRFAEAAAPAAEPDQVLHVGVRPLPVEGALALLAILST